MPDISSMLDSIPKIYLPCWISTWYAEDISSMLDLYLSMPKIKHAGPLPEYAGDISSMLDLQPGTVKVFSPADRRNSVTAEYTSQPL